MGKKGDKKEEKVCKINSN